MDSKDLFLEIEGHLVNEKIKPSRYLDKKPVKNIMAKSNFKILLGMENTLQEKKYHPEGNVWVHTLMVVDYAWLLKGLTSNSKAFMIAALFHDIGKVETTKLIKGKLRSYDHDKVGATILKAILEELDFDKEEEEYIVNVVRHHMYYLYISNNLPYGTLDELKSNTNVKDMILFFLCDRLGRGGVGENEKLEVLKKMEGFIGKYFNDMKEELLLVLDSAKEIIMKDLL